MKKIICLIILTSAVACSRSDKFHIRGIIKNATTGKIYLDEQDINEIHPADSIKLGKRGTFNLHGQTKYPKFYNIHLGNDRILPLLIAPGEKVFISSNQNDFPLHYTVAGSEGSQCLKDLNDRLFITRRKLDSIQNILDNTPAGETEKISEIIYEYNDIVEKQRRFSLQFILDHLTSMASIYAIYQKLNDETFVLYKDMDVQILKIAGATLDTIYPESAHVRSLAANAANLEQQIRTAGIRKLIADAESAIPEITLPDSTGSLIQLSSLNGKVVLLCFWASWDKASTEYNQQLLRLYNKYNQGDFRIYQVSLDTKTSPWMRTVQYDELPWISVIDTTYPKSKVAAVYNIQSLPSTYLISRDGEIRGKNLSIAELNTRIQDLIGE